MAGGTQKRSTHLASSPSMPTHLEVAWRILPTERGEAGARVQKDCPPLPQNPLPFPASSLNGGQGRLLPSTPRCLDLGPPHRPSPTFLPVCEFWRSGGARLSEARMCAQLRRPAPAQRRADLGTPTSAAATDRRRRVLANQARKPPTPPPRKPWTIIIVGSPCPP